MGIYEDIKHIISYAEDRHAEDRHQLLKEIKNVNDWLSSPSCPLTEEEEEVILCDNCGKEITPRTAFDNHFHCNNCFKELGGYKEVKK